jgi:hypothetical protein
MVCHTSFRRDAVGRPRVVSSRGINSGIGSSSVSSEALDIVETDETDEEESLSLSFGSSLKLGRYVVSMEEVSSWQNSIVT